MLVKEEYLNEQFFSYIMTRTSHIDKMMMFALY
jgi:hypothetical protein